MWDGYTNALPFCALSPNTFVIEIVRIFPVVIELFGCFQMT